MKRKYHGLISIVIIGSVLLPTAIYAVYASRVPARIDAARLNVIASEFIVPDTAVMKRISGLEKEIVDMANPKESKAASDQNIRFWHYSDQNYRRYPANDQGGNKINIKTAYALTFTFASNDKEFCIIDGSFYSQGAELPGGGKILKIEPGRVRVKKGESAEWVSLSETTKWGEIE
jgi:hypothetical protein